MHYLRAIVISDEPLDLAVRENLYFIMGFLKESREAINEMGDGYPINYDHRMGGFITGEYYTVMKMELPRDCQAESKYVWAIQVTHSKYDPRLSDNFRFQPAFDILEMGFKCNEGAARVCTLTPEAFDNHMQAETIQKVLH